MSARKVTETALPPPASSSVPAAMEPQDTNAHRRVRWAMYAAFALIAALALLQGWNARQGEVQRVANAALTELLSMQAERAERLSFQGAIVELAPDGIERYAESLRSGVHRYAHYAEQAQARTKDAFERRLLPQKQFQEAWGHMQVADPALFVSGERLLARIDGSEPSGDALTADAHIFAKDARAAMGNNKVFLNLLRDHADEGARHGEQAVLFSVGAVLTLLVALAFAVVEPTVGAVRAQVGRLAAQRAELRRMAMVAARTHAIVTITDPSDRIVWVNAAFERLTGWSSGEAQGRRPAELIAHPLRDPLSSAAITQALRDGTGLRRSGLLARTRAGADLWLDFDIQPVHGAGGALEGFVSVNTDVSERVLEQRKMRALLAALPAGVLVQGADGSVLEANRNALDLLGMTVPQLRRELPRDPGHRFLRADGSELPSGDHLGARTLVSGRPMHNEIQGVQQADGALRWLLVNTEPQLDAAGHIAGVITCFIDMTEQRALQEQLRLTACTDSLTRLPNRSVVMDRLTRALAHAKAHPGYGFAVLFMDFDRFKQVNDTLGHTAGDELLRQIAGRLEAALRPGDALARVASELQTAARVGGDEFVVVLEGTGHLDDVRAVADRLLAMLGQPYTLGAHTVQSGVSIGIVTSEHAGGDADALLRDADTAMYEAKRAGRGRCVVFDTSMHERVMHALSVERDLRLALERDELFVVYQPVVALGGVGEGDAEGDGAGTPLVGVEALVRWRHPTRGLVNPVEFISIAEECGLIDAVGDVVLKKACKQFAAWQRTLGPAAPPLMAVNLSRAQLKLPGLVPEVKWVLEHNGMQPAQLQLEVTESLAAQDAAVQATLRELKALGVKLALDDFGTGYSSLACLHQLPVDTVKIDRSFVRHAETVEYHRVLIEATIRVARTLGMTTVAEGIELPGQASLMHRLHCDRGQGYLYSRPLEADALAAWALQNRHRAGALAA